MKFRHSVVLPANDNLFLVELAKKVRDFSYGKK